MCVDGLDPDLAAEFGYHMPFECKLDIPIDLFEDGVPHTLHVWPSIFRGEVSRHPNLQEINVNPLRHRVRKFLHKKGIKWKRKGEIKYLWKVFKPAVGRTLLDNYSSFWWNIPGVSEGFIFSVSPSYMKTNYEVFKHLAENLVRYKYDIVALYTRLIDWYGHMAINPKILYYEVFSLAKRLPGDIMVVSDHGCVRGNHTDHAYLGCTRSVFAENVLDVRAEIERILWEDKSCTPTHPPSLYHPVLEPSH